MRLPPFGEDALEPPAALHRSFALVASDAEQPKVGQVVGAAFAQGDNVINLKAGALVDDCVARAMPVRVVELACPAPYRTSLFAA